MAKKVEKPFAKGIGWKAYKDPTWEGGVRLEVLMGPFGRDQLSVTAAILMIARLGSAVAGADGWVRSAKWINRKHAEGEVKEAACINGTWLCIYKGDDVGHVCRYRSAADLKKSKARLPAKAKKPRAR